MKRGQFGTFLGASLAAASLESSAQTDAAEPAFRADRYVAHKGAVKLAMYRKRPAAQASGGAALPILMLCHGSSNGALSTFDLTVPGQSDYSMMDAFAREGFDVWALDFEGYGASDRTSGNSDIASGVADLRAAMTVVQRETGQSRAHLFGESSGAIRAAAFAVAAPASVDRLALSAFTYTGKGSNTLQNRAKDVDFYRTHNVRPSSRELYRSIFTRDKLGTGDPAVGDAIYAVELRYGTSIPTGTYLDMVTKLPLVDPNAVDVPTLMARGEYDGIATEEDTLDFFAHIKRKDKQYAVIPGAAHSLVLGYNRRIFWHVLGAFLTEPPRMDKVVD
jgi:pimeloyl-ACP methyl ester carboxylesterase